MITTPYKYAWRHSTYGLFYTNTPNPTANADFAYNNGTGFIITQVGSTYIILSGLSGSFTRSTSDDKQPKTFKMYYVRYNGVSLTKSKTTPITANFPVTYTEDPLILYSLKTGARGTHGISSRTVSQFVVSIYTPVAMTLDYLEYLVIGY